MENSWRNQEVKVQEVRSSSKHGISENWRARSEPFIPGNNHGFYDNWNYRNRDQQQQHTTVNGKFENSKAWRSYPSTKVHEGDRRGSYSFDKKERQPPLSLNVKLLGTMNNDKDSAQFVDGLGQIGTLNTLSEIFPPGNPGRVSVHPAQHQEAWVISQTSGGLHIRVPKVMEELEGNEEELLKVQGERVEPTHTFLQKNRGNLRKFGINIVTSRGMLKSLMVLRKPHDIVVRKTENNILYICYTRPREQDGIDTATGITFEEYLCKDGRDYWEPIKRTYGIYQVTIGQSSILYHAEIDALMSDSKILQNSSSPISPKDFVEVKTISSNTVNSRELTSSFFFNKRLPEWWAQCSLAGIQNIMCGILNAKYEPYEFKSNFIELLKLLELNVTKFPSEFTGPADYENEVWSESSLTQQLDSVLSLIRERFTQSDIEVGKKYTFTVASSRDRRTGRRTPYLRDFSPFTPDASFKTSRFQKR